jgi:hypothetical protein
LNGGSLLDHLSGPLATDLDDSARVVEDLPSEKVDRYLLRETQRIIEVIVQKCAGYSIAC